MGLIHNIPRVPRIRSILQKNTDKVYATRQNVTAQMEGVLRFGMRRSSIRKSSDLSDKGVTDKGK